MATAALAKTTPTKAQLDSPRYSATTAGATIRKTTRKAKPLGALNHDSRSHRLHRTGFARDEAMARLRSSSAWQWGQYWVNVISNTVHDEPGFALYNLDIESRFALHTNGRIVGRCSTLIGISQDSEYWSAAIDARERNIVSKRICG
jgi:hypothetical protein